MMIISTLVLRTGESVDLSAIAARAHADRNAAIRDLARRAVTAVGRLVRGARWEGRLRPANEH